MRLTTHADYCLRVLMFVALKQDELSTIAEISDAFGVSRNHLRKVVHRLSCKGYLWTIRGKNGGFRLARHASKIRVGQVVRDAEEDTVLVECFNTSTSQCKIEGCCVLQQTLRKAISAFYHELDKCTLAALARPKARLSKALGLEMPVYLVK